MQIFRVIAFAAVLAVAGCSAPPEPAPAPAPTSTPAPDPLEGMTQREKVASLMMVGVESYDDAKAKLDMGVGGIFIVSWADPGLLTEPGRDIHALRKEVRRPFDVAIDFEGGRVQRFAHILGEQPAPGAMAASGGHVAAYRTGQEIGRNLRAHGITVDFAPVLDVDGGGLDVVGDRSFSHDPHDAGVYGVAFARGLESVGVDAVFKHFPGHGRASGDTHFGDAVTPPVSEMERHDLIPFAFATQRDVGAAVMVGHMVVPGLGDKPSSLNPAAYHLLRDGSYPGAAPFTRMVYTDDLSGMQAISGRMSTEQAVVEALRSGADQALWSTAYDVPAAIDAVMNALDTGYIHPSRIDAAATRVHYNLIY
ncbi:glycoside hydrolase family 3 protein [Corynebacterium incognita]|uniref:beta-N-acetylhexosaminidase n=1 Tax=Corynebacterium incognita TaxID=2754725 RepID=A0A7G7CRT4_9CORY|nr:glycoside hydrolase family 3 protein [Corynebacterium incognita]QNE90300.1 glycoside hydrolase family 3 protein [Corynebacterium incognita]